MEEKNRPEIMFYAAECMDFTECGEAYDNLSLADAVRQYKKIYQKNSSLGPGIGFVLIDEENDYSLTPYPLYVCGAIAQDQIDLVPAFKEHPLVKQAIKDISVYLHQLTKAERGSRGVER